jgi:hypothetical protein
LPAEPRSGNAGRIIHREDDAERSRTLVDALSAPNTPIFVSGSMTIGKEVAKSFNLSPPQCAATEELLRGFVLKLAEWEKANDPSR